MIPLNLPKYEFKIKRLANNKLLIFDDIRKKEVVLTPEEWVRQNFIQFVIQEQKIPQSLIAVEKELTLNGVKKRFDVLIYNTHGKPYVLIECKSAEVSISQTTFDQIARYNMVLKVPYLVVTNGLNHYYCEINHNEKKYSFLQKFPVL